MFVRVNETTHNLRIYCKMFFKKMAKIRDFHFVHFAPGQKTSPFIKKKAKKVENQVQI